MNACNDDMPRVPAGGANWSAAEPDTSAAPEPIYRLRIVEIVTGITVAASRPRIIDGASGARSRARPDAQHTFSIRLMNINGFEKIERGVRLDRLPG